MKVVSKHKNINIEKRLTNGKFSLIICFLLVLFSFFKPIIAQNHTFPNSNQPLKPLTLQELHQQQQIRIQQQNRERMENFGYQPPQTQQQMTVDYYDQQAMLKQRKTQELYQLINAIDNETNSNSEEFNSLFPIADTNSVIFKNYIPHYYSAYNEISNMLSCKVKPSLKRAVFVVENAYHQNKLNYDKYCNQINEVVFVCKSILKEKGLKSDNYMACQYAIQKLFSDKFTYKNSKGKDVVFEPFSYDFDDYMGNDDHTKLFVTKLLNTRNGQCHSLPLLYLIIAEELNVNAYLGLAPNHSYVKFGNQYQSYNFETTNSTFVTDKWIVASGYISSTAIKNQIYLAPLTKNQVIAECLVDLSIGLESYVGKSDFTISCANTALNYCPNSIRSGLIINNYLVAKCANIAKKYNFPKESEYYKYPELKGQFDQMVENELKIERTGFIKIPKEQYEKWQLTATEEKQRQEHLRLLEKLQQSTNEQK